MVGTSTLWVHASLHESNVTPYPACFNTICYLLTPCNFAGNTETFDVPDPFLACVKKKGSGYARIAVPLSIVLQQYHLVTKLWIKM